MTNPDQEQEQEQEQEPKVIYAPPQPLIYAPPQSNSSLAAWIVAGILFLIVGIPIILCCLFGALGALGVALV